MAKRKHIKISDLPELKYEGASLKDIAVFDSNSQSYSMKNVFEFIKKLAMQDEGLTVELVDGNIIFIKGKK
jgi:hypothetical protein